MPRMIEGKRFFSIAETADSAGVSRQTLWRWRSGGSIPAGHRYRGGQVVFSESETQVIRAYANRLEPAVVSRPVDAAQRVGENKANYRSDLPPPPVEETV
jgi:predicted DNA-binding transcriptional regulator AlpA